MAGQAVNRWEKRRFWESSCGGAAPEGLRELLTHPAYPSGALFRPAAWNPPQAFTIPVGHWQCDLKALLLFDCRASSAHYFCEPLFSIGFLLTWFSFSCYRSDRLLEYNIFYGKSAIFYKAKYNLWYFFPSTIVLDVVWIGPRSAKMANT